MNLDFETLSDAEILGILRRARVVPRKGSPVLQRYPTNHGRKEVRRRDSFRVWVGNQAVVHLVVGPGLVPLHRRSQAFCRANPAISCRPLFLIRHGDLDLLGSECFGLFNLEEALAARRIDAAAWQQAVRQLASALEATARRSSLAHLMTELAELEQRVLAIEAFARLDQLFLRETVFPLVRHGATSQPILQTTWTNGDFIAKNIVLDERGEARLVDYEFARRTHFAAGNWFRLRHFSNVPGSLRLEDFPPLGDLPRWLEIHCWLEHAVKMNDVCSLPAMQRDLPKISDKLARLVEAATETRHDSVFFALTNTSREPGTGSGPPAPDEALTVEWSRHGSPRYSREARVPLQPRNWTEVGVDLSGAHGRTLYVRLRLPEVPGIVELRGMEVHGRDRANVLWTVDSDKLGTVLSSSGNLIETATAEGLGLIHFGGESLVALPSIRLGRMDDVVGLAFWVRFVPSLLDFSQRLRHAFAAGDAPALFAEGQPLTLLEGEEPPAAVVAQLFFPTDDARYVEDRSVRARLRELNTWTELTFEVPALPAGAVLRFDPADQPGSLEIDRITLEPLAAPGASTARIVARHRPHSHLEGLRCEGDALFVPDDGGVRILMFGPDPILKLAPLEPELAGRPGRLAINLRYTAGVPPAVWTAALQSCQSALFNWQGKLHQLEAHSGQSLATAEAENANLRGELGCLQAAVDAGGEAARRAAAELQQAVAAADERQRQAAQNLAAAQESVARGEQALQAAAGREAGLNQIRENLANELGAVRREFAGLQERAARGVEERLHGEQALAQERETTARLAREIEAATVREAGLAREIEAATVREASLARDCAGLSAAVETARGETIRLQELTARLEKELQAGSVREAILGQDSATLSAALATARGELAALEERLTRESDEHRRVEQTLAVTRTLADRAAEEAVATIATLEAAFQEAGDRSKDLERRHDLVLDSLYAQNEHIRNLEHIARIVCEAHDLESAPAGLPPPEADVRLEPGAEALAEEPPLLAAAGPAPTGRPTAKS